MDKKEKGMKLSKTRAAALALGILFSSSACTKRSQDNAGGSQKPEPGSISDHTGGGTNLPDQPEHATDPQQNRDINIGGPGSIATPSGSTGESPSESPASQGEENRQD